MKHPKFGYEMITAELALRLRQIEIDALPPAQRGYVNRVIRQKAREETAARFKAIEKPAPVGNAAYVSLYLNDSAIGCGYRDFVVTELGPRIVKLFFAPRLMTVEVDRFTFDKYATKLPLKKLSLIKRIQDRIEDVARWHGHRDITKQVEAAETALMVLAAVRDGERQAA